MAACPRSDIPKAEMEQFISELQKRPEIWNYKLPTHFSMCGRKLAELSDIFSQLVNYIVMSAFSWFWVDVCFYSLDFLHLVYELVVYFCYFYMSFEWRSGSNGN